MHYQQMNAHGRIVAVEPSGRGRVPKNPLFTFDDASNLLGELEAEREYLERMLDANQRDINAVKRLIAAPLAP